MFTNPRRATRKNVFLPALVSVQNAQTKQLLTAPFFAHITNMFKQGACLFITKVMDERMLNTEVLK